MEGAPVTAATGTLGPVISKLAALLGSEYKLRWRTRRDVKFIRSKLKPVHSILWNIWETEELDEAAKALKMEALDLADEVDDAIVDFILSLECSRSSKRLIQIRIKASPFKDFKKRASDVSRRCRSKWKQKKKPSSPAPAGKPRAYPFVRKDAAELVGIFETRDELIRHLVGGEGSETARLKQTIGISPVELQLKTATIYGLAGMGKTTLADLVYEAIRNKIQYRAFVSVTPGGNMREVLQGILEQVAANNTSVPLAGTSAATAEDLINIISNFLKYKRYLVIIDDIWNWREWEIIMKSLPENNLGSRIVRTTRIIDVANKWRYDYYDCNDLRQDMLPIMQCGEKWAGRANIATEILAMKADLVGEGFNYKHPIVHMCGGMPLAVLGMLSAVSKEREKQGQHAKTCDVQDEIENHVMENGIQNTPGFEALVESLQLGYDDLPHPMLKTCLLYCSIYPDGHNFEMVNFVSRWISEGFAHTEEEANSYFEELVNRGLLMHDSSFQWRMHPMMQNFLRWKSHEANFITCSSQITHSYNTYRIRRLCIDNSPYRSRDEAADPLSALDWCHIRSLVVAEGIKRVPFEKLEGVRVLDLGQVTGLLECHWRSISGLVRLRHLLGLNCELPPEIVRLQCLETFEACGEGFTRLPGYIGNLQQLRTLYMHSSNIRELPNEIWSLQQLRTLDISRTGITVLPEGIGELQQLKTLDISNTSITVLPKGIGKLQHLEHLLMRETNVAKIPREIGGLKELKSLGFDHTVAALPLEVCALVELPECIHQALNKSGVVSKLAGEMISFRRSRFITAGEGIVIGAKQMHVPSWIREHFNDLHVLDIRICKLEEQGLKILRDMPRLKDLTLSFQIVPKEPVVISGEGFAMLRFLTIDSRLPRVTFQEGAMSKLSALFFQFQFYSGAPNNDPVGINHLRSLDWIEFTCTNKDWYPGRDSPCIRQTIDVVRKEAQEHPNSCRLKVCGRMEEIYSSLDSPPPLPETGQQRETEERSN